MIVFTKTWRLMDDTRAILVGHVSVHNYAESPVLVLRKVQSGEKATTRLGEGLIRHLLGKILKHGRVSPTSHVLASELTDFLELGLFRIFVYGFQSRFKKNIIQAAFLVVYFYVIVVWVNAERKIRRKCPGCSRPGQNTCLWIVDERE